MIFDQTVKRILEDFNIYPQAQNAVSAGPDQGMTTADINNTFPSKIGTVFIKKLKKRNNRKYLKKTL
jgi:hypothetical protein